MRRFPAPEIAPHVAGLIPYQPGKPIAELERELGIRDIIKLASNENALGPSPAAVEAIRAHAGDVHLYPEGSCPALRSALAAKLRVDGSCLAFGNGSDEIIHFLGLAFLTPGDQVIQGSPTFSRYEAAARLAQAQCVRIPLRDWRYDLDAVGDAITAQTRLVFIANPNNPTGTYVTEAELERLLDRISPRCIVCMDEAYFEYADAPDYPDTVALIREQTNIVILRTFSKLYGLAGLRVGYAVARPEIIAAIEQVREPFNVNHLAQVAALAALGDADHAQRSRAMVASGRAVLTDGLRALGMDVVPSQANFVWADTRRDAQAIFQALLRRGVIVRTGGAFGAPTCIRVTVGTAEQNERLLNTLAEVLAL